MKPEVKIKGLKLSLEFDEFEVPKQEDNPSFDLSAERNVWNIKLLAKLEKLRESESEKGELDEYIKEVKQKIKDYAN